MSQPNPGPRPSGSPYKERRALWWHRFSDVDMVVCESDGRTVGKEGRAAARPPPQHPRILNATTVTYRLRENMTEKGQKLTIRYITMTTYNNLLTTGVCQQCQHWENGKWRRAQTFILLSIFIEGLSISSFHTTTGTLKTTSPNRGSRNDHLLPAFRATKLCKGGGKEEPS